MSLQLVLQGKLTLADQESVLAMEWKTDCDQDTSVSTKLDRLSTPQNPFEDENFTLVNPLVLPFICKLAQGRLF